MGSSVEQEDEKVALETDILFESNSRDLPKTAQTSIKKLLDKIPDNAHVNVDGHTDSLPVPEHLDFDNQKLFEERANAVADAIEEVRSDLKVTPKGYGDTKPAVEEDEKDPSTYSANRRVEVTVAD